MAIMSNKPQYDYDKLYNRLLYAHSSSPLFKTVQKAMKSRGHWKNKPRGTYAKEGISGLQKYNQRNQ